MITGSGRIAKLSLDALGREQENCSINMPRATGDERLELVKDDKLAKAQAQVEEIRIVMNQNLDLALKRGETLEEMERKAVALNESGDIFAGKATKLRRYFQCQNYKRTACIVFIILAIIGVIVGAIYASAAKN